MRKAFVILVIGVGLPTTLLLSGIFEGVNGTHIGQHPNELVGFWGAIPTPKPIITGAVTAANLEAALAAAGLVATATPTPSATATFTPTPTPTP